MVGSIAAYQQVLLSASARSDTTVSTTIVTYFTTATSFTSISPLTVTDLSTTIDNQTVASTLGSNGLELLVSMNATQITVGDSLRISVSLFNTLSSSNRVQTSTDWPFRGVPLSLWEDCYGTPASAQGINFTAPAEVVVLPGDYAKANISTVANVNFPYESCHEGANIDHVLFQPISSEANLTGLSTGYAQSANLTTGPYQVSKSFNTNGYWNLRDNRFINDTGRAFPAFISYVEPQPPLLSPTATPFAPGLYTVAIADEWGQEVILHLTVTSGK
jgi:hypothetical protein